MFRELSYDEYVVNLLLILTFTDLYRWIDVGPGRNKLSHAGIL
jgi:hypothetical protein